MAVPEARLEKLGDRDTEPVAEAILRQLRHPDPALRKAAQASLTPMEHGRKALLRALLESGIHSEGYGFQIELAYRAWLLGFRVGESPISFREREHGHRKTECGRDTRAGRAMRGPQRPPPRFRILRGHARQRRRRPREPPYDPTSTGP